ncbi:hypothetical protein PQR52_29685 [Paraburkholderia aspalathi]|uniref:hypothetical protein n=1 Tax=Paraburkholderia aspalathi TaxID=1324617 RepID=UPI0038BABF61
MDASEKYWWPLVGVALGWLLTSFSSSLKERGERRYRTGELLYKLMHIENQLNVMIWTVDAYWEHAKDCIEYENYRKGISDRHFLEPVSQLDDLAKSIDSVSGPYPLDALKLHSLINILRKCKMANFQESSKNLEIYVRLISAHDVALEQTRKQISINISRLARRHGILTFIKIKIHAFKIGKHKKKNENFLRRFSGEILGAVKKGENQNLSSEAPKGSST